MAVGNQTNVVSNAPRKRPTRMIDRYEFEDDVMPLFENLLTLQHSLSEPVS
jgi:hypothetical protein